MGEGVGVMGGRGQELTRKGLGGGGGVMGGSGQGLLEVEECVGHPWAQLGLRVPMPHISPLPQ